MPRPRGRKPLPTELKKRRGTHRPHRDRPGDAVTGDVGTPDLPRSIATNKEALAAWTYYLPLIKKQRTLAREDLMELTALCLAWARLVEAERAIKEHGLLIVRTSRYGQSIMANPAIPVQNKASMLIYKLGADFGLSPEARTRIRPAPSGDAPAADDAPSAEGFIFKKRHGKVVGRIA